MTASERPPRRGFRVSPGWVVVAAAALILFGAAGSRFSFGVFLRPLTDEFGWSRGSLSGALAVAGLFTALLRPAAGWLSDRFDPRRVAIAGIVVGASALLLLAGIQKLWQLYALFIVMGVGFTLASPATTTKLVSTWFSRRRGLALSIATSGSAIGETSLVPLAAFAVVVSGWRSAYAALAIVLLALVVPAALRFLRANTAGLPPDEMTGNEAPQKRKTKGSSSCAWAPREGLTLRQAVRTPVFWALTAGFFT